MFSFSVINSVIESTRYLSPILMLTAALCSLSKSSDNGLEKNYVYHGTTSCKFVLVGMK